MIDILKYLKNRVKNIRNCQHYPEVDKPSYQFLQMFNKYQYQNAEKYSYYQLIIYEEATTFSGDFFLSILKCAHKI